MNQWQEAEQYVDRALEMFERGRWVEAEVELRKAFKLILIRGIGTSTSD